MPELRQWQIAHTNTVLSTVVLETNTRASKEWSTGQVNFKGREGMGFLYSGKLLNIRHFREGSGGTGENHEDTGDSTQRGIERKGRWRQRESWPPT